MTTSMPDIIAQMEREREENAKLAETGREAIVKLLVDNKIDYLRIDFSGQGDSGCIDGFFTKKDGWDTDPKLGQNTPAHKTIEDWAYKFLEGTGVDWYNNDGGQGKIVFDLRDVPYKFIANVDQNETVSNTVWFTEEVA